MKALILGGSGFVGRRLAEILATSDVDTTVLNRGVTPVSAPPASSESPRTAPLVVVSYGHVDDLCRALIVMATQPAAVGEIFNVTPGAVTSAAYIDTLAAVTGAEDMTGTRFSMCPASSR